MLGVERWAFSAFRRPAIGKTALREVEPLNRPCLFPFGNIWREIFFGPAQRRHKTYPVSL